jgi:ELWxxDGT repeat protein
LSHCFAAYSHLIHKINQALLMKIKNVLIAIVCTLLYTHPHAQNNDGLQSINKQKLESLLKEHKQVHFVTTNGSKGAEVKFYIENNKPQTQAMAQSAGNSSAVVNFHLVKDINTQTDANPVNPGLNINSDDAYAILNNIMYFSANDGVNGAELWRSDGTAAGTFMVKDIEPGSNGSNPSEITVSANKIIFSTQNKITFNYALWVSDGTAAGTSILKSNLLGSGPGVNSMYELTNVAGTVYFFLNYNSQLWKTNGTVPGTSLVKDMGAVAYAPLLPVAANGLFYFTMYSNANGRELWRSDGTDAGTFMLKDISPGFDFFAGPEQLTVFNNKLYFTANDGTGRKLWLTDGTSSGTALAGGQNNVLFIDDDIITDFFNRPFIVTGSSFYTAALTGATGTELYKYNIVTGFSLVKDITPGMPGGQFFYFEKFANNVAFTYYDSVNRQNQLWRSDGTTANTVLIQSYGGDTITLANLHAGNNLLYFTSNATNGYELWKTNGTPAGTGLIKDIYTGPTSTNPANVTLYKDKMFFKAASKNAGTELWQTDGTEAGTTMLPEINTVATNYSAPDYSFSYYYGNSSTPGAAIDKTLYFSATTPETGYEVYRSNGIAAGTTPASDLIPGEKNSTPRDFITKNHAVYFTSYSSSGNSINKIDSTGNVRTIVSTGSYINSYDVAGNGLVFYSFFNYLTNKHELWRVADNGSGNIMLCDKLADNNYRFIVKVVNNKAYFTAADENGTELWVSNGNVAGTRMVKDIFAGSNGSNPFSLYGYNNNIFFGADDGSGPALWQSNGTNAVKVKNIVPYASGIYSTDYNDFFCVVNDVLYLNASTANKGFELWKTNGTAAGTALVKDITAGTESSNPAFLTNVNGTLFFSISNYQLWKSDGTANGTVIVKNNISSSDSYLFTERCVADGKLFFNTEHLLWVSDGTDAGTHQVADNSLNGVSNVKNLVAADNLVFFNGTTDKYNAELYAGDATRITSTASTAVKQVQPQSFSAVVLQNPVVSQLNLQVQSSRAQSLIITVTNMNGNIIAQKTVEAVKGNNGFSLNASNWQTGIHAIKISNTNGEMISLKVLK